MLKNAIESEGLDRPIHRPDTKQPSVEDLELMAWLGRRGFPYRVGSRPLFLGLILADETSNCSAPFQRLGSETLSS